MPGWSQHTGKAVSLALSNVDTDQLIPARFMSVPRVQGYGDYLLHDLRRDDKGQLLENLPLNRHPNASVLIAGHNFGSGSSREAAVYALVDAGFRAILAPSFGDIFAGNAVNNGLLPARVNASEFEKLISHARDDALFASVDLEQQTAIVGEISIGFVMEDAWKMKLLNGWDDIDLTRQHAAATRNFKDQRQKAEPWAWPNAMN